MEEDPQILGLSFRALVEHIPFDVWVRDAEGKLAYANAIARDRWKMLEQSGGGLDAVPADVRAGWMENTRRALAGETVRGEFTYVIDGKRAAFYNVVVPILRAGAIIGTAGISVDVSKAHDAEREAERLGGILRDVFAACPIAMGVRTVRDGDLIHDEDNPPSAALFGAGTTPDDIRGKSDREMGVPQKVIDRAIGYLRSANGGKQSGPYQLVVPSPDGKRTIEGYVFRLRDEAEERYAFIAHDITELLALQTSLVRSERLATLGTLSAAISHEIGNPAMYAQLNLQAAVAKARKEIVSPDLLASIEAALTGVEQIGRLLRDVRSLAIDNLPAMESGDVSTALGTVLDLVRPIAKQRAAIHVTRTDVPIVRLGQQRLVQVILNLVKNALDALDLSERFGNVWIDVKRPEERGPVIVDVGDDGPGIPDAVRASLFGPFVTTKSTGTGLGLYMCRMLVTKAGGTIAAGPRSGGGTCMHVEIPAVG